MISSVRFLLMKFEMVRAALFVTGPLFNMVLGRGFLNWVHALHDTPTLYPSPQVGGRLHTSRFFLWHFVKCAGISTKNTMLKALSDLLQIMRKAQIFERRQPMLKASLPLVGRDIGWGYCAKRETYNGWGYRAKRKPYKLWQNETNASGSTP